MDKYYNKYPDLKDKVNIINHGSLIDTNKRCPLINAKCIKEECNSFKKNNSVHIIGWEESLELKKESKTKEKWWTPKYPETWELNYILSHQRLNGLDENIYIFSLEDTDENFGRCIAIGGNR